MVEKESGEVEGNGIKACSWFVFVSDSSPTIAFGSVAPLKDDDEYERERGVHL